MQDDGNDDSEESGERDDRDDYPNPPDNEVLARWWRAYCKLPLPRAWTVLRDKVGGAKARVRKAVLEGWPEHGVVAFKDREIVPDEAVAELVHRVQERTFDRVATVVANRWEEDARSHIANLPAMGAAIARLVETVKAASEHISFLKYRRVPDLDEHGKQRRDAEGNPVTLLKPYVSGPDVALAMQRVAAAQKDHAVLNKALLDSLAPFQESAIDFSDAPPEAMEYLLRKFGGVGRGSP